MGITKAQVIYPLVDNTTKETSELVLHQKHLSFIFKHFWKGTNQFFYFILLTEHYTSKASKNLYLWIAIEIEIHTKLDSPILKF